jgi:uncharacterized protein YggU (UPF0235/DUF167 family)
MAGHSLNLVTKPGGLALAVKVVPRSSRQRIAGEYAGGIKITVTKEPVAGAANQAVIAVLAQSLQISPTQIQIIHGHGSPRKEVLIAGLSAELIQQRLLGNEK